MNLTVIEKFGEHEVGEIIADAKKVEAILASEWARFVVKVAGEPGATAMPETETKT